MRLIGLLGGMSWESTEYYYRHLNRGIRSRLGGLHSARCILFSVDFADVETMQAAGAWDEAAAYLGECAGRLQSAGAECIILCTNTMHRVYESLQAAVEVPVLHIADGTGSKLKDAGICQVALLGTRYTMEEAFYRERLEHRGLRVLTPDAGDRVLVHKVIYEELCLGQVRGASRSAFVTILNDLQVAGAEAVILGCTELGLLVGPADSPIPVFDTTLIHVETALDWALGGQ